VNVTKTTTLFCVAVSAVVLYAAPARAAPLSAAIALNSAESQNSELMQYRRSRHYSRWGAPRDRRSRRHSRWGAPRAYFGYGYNSYAHAPGYTSPRYRSYRYGASGCTGEGTADAAFPSWMCSGRRYR